jgi:hypothetical protein
MIRLNFDEDSRMRFSQRPTYCPYMSANINIATKKTYDLTMNLGVPNLNLRQVIFLLSMLCAAYTAEK